MKLKELGRLFGVATKDMQSEWKKQRRYTLIVYALDVVVMLGLTAMMFVNNAQLEIYGVALVFVVIVVNLLLQLKSDGGASGAHKLYRKYGNRQVAAKSFNITDEAIKAILQELDCAGDSDKTLDEFKAEIIAYAKLSIKNSTKASSALMRYGVQSGNVGAYFLEIGDKPKSHQYFIDFVDDISEEENEE